jgi:hypothetical protein
MNKHILVTAVILLLVACGGGDNNASDTDGTLNDNGADNATGVSDAQASSSDIGLADLSAEFDPDGVVINACSAPYYRELAGTYDGQITYQTADNACLWEVLLVVTPTYDLSDDELRQSCVVTGNYRSVQLSPSAEDASNCQDISVAEKLLEPYAIPVNNRVWLTPSWPVTAEMPLTISLPAGQVYPVGNFSADSDQVSVEFLLDGLGNVTVNSSSGDASDWDGVLVKR